MAIEKPISELLTSIEKGEYTIPEFQRGYVWSPTQVKEYFRSLYLNYPTGSFLIWKTEEASKLRGKQQESNSIYKHIILDGQQRFTTIYTIFNGETPSWYEGVSLRTDLYFSLEEEEFQYYKPMKMANKVEWLNVSEFLSEGGLNNLIGKMQTLPEDARDYYQSKLLQLKKLDDIRNYGYYIKEIQETNLEKIVEVFNLVNSSGTPLTESDLAMAIVSSMWPDVKDKFRETQAEFEKYDFPFSFAFFIRCLNIIACERGKFFDIKKTTKEELEAAWKTLKDTLHYLINILREHAYVDALRNLSTVYVLYTLVYYLSKNNNKFPTSEDMNKFIYWMFMAQLWGIYSGSSETQLEKDINELKESNSVDSLINSLKLFRGSNLELSPEDLYLQGTNSRIYNVFYAALRSRDARDWTDTNLSLYSKNIGYRNKLEKHHIFPKGVLYKKYNAKKSVDKRLVNEIANMAFITEKSNKDILDDEPSIYLPNIDKNELRKQFVPTDSQLWALNEYEMFLAERRRLLCEGINQFLNGYFKTSAGDAVPKDLEHLDRGIELIEIALRNKISEILSDASDDGLDEYIKPDLNAKVKDRVSGWLKKNPGEDKEQFKSFRKKLDFFDLQEYKDTICYKSNWQYFEDLFGSKGNVEVKFNQLGNLRNAIRHSRDLNEVIVKEGEAAIAWFNSILKSYDVPIVEE